MKEAFDPAMAGSSFASRIEACSATGPRAGLIDDHMGAKMGASDFIVADLAHDNLGAYREAGFAEGLGKPVANGPKPYGRRFRSWRSSRMIVGFP